MCGGEAAAAMTPEIPGASGVTPEMSGAQNANAMIEKTGFVVDEMVAFFPRP